jgi:hypothetical protein
LRELRVDLEELVVLDGLVELVERLEHFLFRLLDRRDVGLLVLEQLGRDGVIGLRLGLRRLLREEWGREKKEGCEQGANSHDRTSGIRVG